MVERTIRSENQRCPNRPIYLVGESLGACIALDVAARNPNIDLILILANPGNVVLLSIEDDIWFHYLWLVGLGISVLYA